MEALGNLDCRDSQDNTPLLVAIRKQRYLLVDYLLEQGADACVQNNQGNTTLIFAAYCAPVALCEKLFARRADVNARNARGITPLMAAAITGNVAVARWLLEHGATLHAIEKHAALPAPHMVDMMRKLGRPIHAGQLLITDLALANKILPRLPHILTWL